MPVWALQLICWKGSYMPVSSEFATYLLTLGAHAQRVLGLCVCVCVSGATYSLTTRNKAANKRYQWVQCYTGLVFKMAIV